MTHGPSNEVKTTRSAALGIDVYVCSNLLTKRQLDRTALREDNVLSAVLAEIFLTTTEYRIPLRSKARPTRMVDRSGRLATRSGRVRIAPASTKQSLPFKPKLDGKLCLALLNLKPFHSPSYDELQEISRLLVKLEVRNRRPSDDALTSSQAASDSSLPRMLASTL